MIPRQTEFRNAAQTPAHHRVTSMCMEIAGFDHEDCPGDWCMCACHQEHQP